MNKPDYKKIIQALNYITELAGGKVNYMKALKLLYFSDRLHLREYGRLITDDNLIAMKNGTLGSQAKDIIKMNEFMPHVVYEYVEDKLKRDNYFIEVNSTERDNLSETDIECLNEVFTALGQKAEFELANLTHELPEWEKHQYAIEKEGKRVVDLDILDLFKSSENEVLKLIYSQSDSELELSKDLFTEYLEQKMVLS